MKKTLAVMFTLPMLLSSLAIPVLADNVAEGKKIAFQRRGTSGVGNCLACHAIADGESPGNMGPPLVAIKARFPNRNDLRARLYDPTVANPISAMPPFGKHGILTDEEIEKVIDYLYTL
ncbi:sulfur oxidation c-type cytochrome SoxX [Candidatus Persebacteraceae bacterium Df01]|jgi:sulfur-oxidizing protein SoxX|uniref:Sulfur oxidation c-type cytochrome SoxX n=1 Tax=Candidatus Doriopsillibacter californiensis TaxID=2970740 RepID=A0ABT7QJI3_9GAMM|nr:sulfur oxidation c-type cytochrome SoxX [Candidatus Persebacteraceae bacterium Df01]